MIQKETILEKYLEFARENGADLAKRIDAGTVVTAPWTIYRCRFGCASYGKNHYCPPHAPTWDKTRQMIDCYSYGILFRCREMGAVSPLAVKLARELFLDDYYKVIAFGCGACVKCKKCNPEFCNFPGQTVPPMEACGIDVFATVRNNGIELHTLRLQEEPHSYFGLVLVE